MTLVQSLYPWLEYRLLFFDNSENLPILYHGLIFASQGRNLPKNNQSKNGAMRNCWISARGAIKLHHFSTSAERSKARVLNRCNFIAPQVLIQ